MRASQNETVDVWSLAANLFDPPKTGAVTYRDDPEGFIRNCFTWKDGEGPTSYQLRIIKQLLDTKRLCVRAPHGAGKSTTSTWTVLWFALTRDAGGEDWKCVTTASAWRQLEKYLWPEIHKWVKRIRWDVVGREPFTPRELMALRLKLDHGEAFAAACEDPAKIEGAHADQVLFIFDEAKAIPEATYDAAEGAFSGGGASGGQEAYAVATSTPGAPVGRFWQIQTQKPGTQDWTVAAVKLEEIVKEGRISREWVENRRKQWGSTSAVFINRVLGEFAESEADGVIPLSWVEAAMERWHEARKYIDTELPVTIGADIARSGDDRTVVTKRTAWVITDIKRLPKQGTMETAELIDRELQKHHHPSRQCTAVIDVIGIGAGVVDRLRQMSPERIVPFNASEATTRKDRSGELGFVNARASAYWHLRELLDPDSGYDIAFGSDDREIEDQIIGDLTAPKFKQMAGGKILLESKDDIRKRINRSTDVGDAIVMCYWPTGGVTNSLQAFADDPDLDFFAAPVSSSRWDLGSNNLGGGLVF